MAKNKNQPEPLRRPDNTAFTQQRLPAWQPLLSTGIVLPVFFFFGFVFIGIGVGLYYSSNSIQELELDYSGADTSNACYKCVNYSRFCVCSIDFTIPDLFKGPVFLYYELSNFYQNIRRYQSSKDDSQLSGSLYSLKNPATECAPYKLTVNNTPIAPCGAAANSMFNDTFLLYYKVNGTYTDVPLDKKGISWWSDYNIKFRNPNNTTGNLSEIFNGTAKPANWDKPAYQLDTDTFNNGFINEDFIVWMRIAALPSFRKLYCRIEKGNFTEGLQVGEYRLNVTYNYPVLSFRGRKKVIFSSVSWMGGKNLFLSIVYLVFGMLCVLTGFIMILVHLKYQEQNIRAEM